MTYGILFKLMSIVKWPLHMRISNNSVTFREFLADGQSYEDREKLNVSANSMICIWD
jgi:hypothetical protein